MKTTIIDIAHIENYGKKDFPDGLVLFSDEWNLRKYQCENFINSRNGIFDRKIHGRKCIVKEISAVEGKKFFSNHHIQGSNNLGIVFFGLFYKDELIGVMSLGRHSRQIAENRIVLDRFCIAYGVHVRGGANKLFHKCVEWAKSRKYDEIISFSDNRLTDGNVYKIMGFYLEKNHKPDYCYVDTKNPVKRLSKQSQKKSSSKCPDDLTEFEWAEKRGLKKLWDKGKKRWVYNLDDSRKTWKQNLSQKCAEQNRKGEFKHSHIRGYFFSNKCGKEIYYGSSYELRCIYLLEKNSNVLSYERAEVFVDSEKNSRNPDIKVTYIDNSKEILEVKPESRFFKEENVKKQILETEKYAKAMGYKFSVWTEKNSGLSDASSIIKWAKIYIGKITGNKDWLEKQKENGRKRSKKHYDEKISTDKVSVYCEFCKEEHKALRLNYEKNIARNNRYICEREGGYIAGSKPKLHLRKDNNHVNEGKKQCNECNEVLPFERFSPDSSRRDGYCSKCKECRSKKMKERYNKKKT